MLTSVASPGVEDGGRRLYVDFPTTYLQLTTDLLGMSGHRALAISRALFHRAYQHAISNTSRTARSGFGTKHQTLDAAYPVDFFGSCAAPRNKANTLT